jgi:chloride channel protein, CIC family
MAGSKWLTKLIRWQEHHVEARQRILILSLLVGIEGSLAAVFLKNLVFQTNRFILRFLHIETANLLYLALPLIGILLTVIFVRLCIHKNISHGITRVLKAISKRDSVLGPHNLFSSLVGSTLTVGFGGSAGLEAPIVLTGAAFGSNLGRLLKQDYRTTTLLIGCGAAAAISGIFKAPIAAIVFGLEVLLLDLTMWSVIPLLISSVTGAVVAYFLLGREVVFDFTLFETFHIQNLPYYMLLGVICGLVSLYFTKVALAVENRLNRVKNPYNKVLIGGILLGLMIFLLPPLYGEGYESLKQILSGNAINLANNSLFYNWRTSEVVFIGFLGCIILFKVVAMAITTGSGGVGGIFAPSLYTGGITGYITARLINNLNFIHVPEQNFALVGMAGLMSGVMHAPLTGIFLIAEITGGYALFIPLIVTSTISLITIRYFEPHSLYHIRLAQSGELITHHKDQAVLRLLKLDKVIERDLETVHPDAKLGELVKVVSHSKRNIFPVVDENGLFMGVVLLDDIRDIMFNQELYDSVTVLSLMNIPPAYVDPAENMESVMRKFTETEMWNLPVVENGKYIGFVSKSKIFSAYREMLMGFSEE